MFTGIIEGMAPLVRIEKGIESAVLHLDLGELAQGVVLGDSISVNGCCLTVVGLESSMSSFDVMTESLNVTSLGDLVEGGVANVERAMAADGRFGGHVVSGHVDGCAEIVSIEEKENSHYFTFKISKNLIQDMLLRGSVAVDGVSLTICGLDQKAMTFTVSIIPITLKETLFGCYKIGDRVNIETDMMSKYIRSHVERILVSQPSN